MQTDLNTRRASSRRSLAALLVLLACGCTSRTVVGGTGGANGSSTGGTGAGPYASGKGGSTGGTGSTAGAAGLSSLGTGGTGGTGTAGSSARGTGGGGAAGHPDGGAAGTGGTNADSGIPQSCQLSVDLQTCYQLNAPCTGGRFAYNAQSGSCDQVCLCTGLGTFATRAACASACIEAVAQVTCAAAGGACTPDQYSACPAGQEPIYPQPKRDCAAGGHCCVTAPQSACASGTNGAGECLIGSKCINPGLAQSKLTCEEGRVCCEPSTRGSH
jgi:hypothetical protein